jgi:hypothetical protein
MTAGAALLSLIGVLCTPLAHAKPAPSVPKETKPATAPIAAEKVIYPPSRLVAPTELKAYLETLSSQFQIRGRVTDPFGQIQDPNVKPVVKAPSNGAIKRPTAVLATPFPELIRRITITTVMPGEKRFLVGTRSIKQGDQIPLTFRGKPIRVQVTEVNSQQIAFRNLDSGEITLRKLDIMPAGMTAGQHGAIAPGMVADRPNLPIELDTASPKSP